MSRNLLEIPRLYEDDKPLTQEILDASFNEISTWGNIQVANNQQLLQDLFRPGYTLDNDGNSNYTKSLEDRMEFPNLFIYSEDFVCVGAALNSSALSSYWISSGTDSTVTVNEEEGGTLHMETNAASPADATVSFRAAIFHPLLQPIFEFYLRADSIEDVKWEGGLRIDADNYAVFRFDTNINASNLYVAGRNSALTAVQVDTDFNMVPFTYIKLKLAFVSFTEIAWYVNETRVAQTYVPIGTLSATSTWKPYFYLQNRASDAKFIDIDYTRITQLRNF